MRKYTYQARNSDDQMVKGVIEAKNVRNAREALIDRGLVTVEVLPQIRGAFSREIPSKELAVFCRQLSMIMQSDITIIRGLPMLLEQVENRQLARTLTAVLRSMEHGETYSDAVTEQYGPFPRYLVNMVQIGEMSGTLDIVMRQLSDYYEKENRTQRKVRTATTYPAILGVMMLAVLGMLMVQVLPVFNNILMGMNAQLPAITLVLMSVSGFLARWIIPIIVALIAIIFLVTIWGKTPSGRLFVGRLQVKMPVIRRFYTRLYTSRFARSLALLLKSGVNMATALQMMEHLIGNAYIERRIAKISSRLETGSSLYEPLQALKIFPPLLLRMVRIGEETGKIDDMLFSSASLFDEEVDEAIDRLTALIEPVLIIILSIIVGFVLMSVMLPMTNIMSSIG